MKRLCICVDDFGLHAGVNAAALRLAGLGRITAITCLVGGSAWQESSASLLSVDAKNIDLGLHLDFTEYPLLGASRQALSTLVLRAYCRRLERDHVRSEIIAQLDAFERALGRAPDFVDGHQHVHQLPVIRDELMHVLLRRYPQQKPWLRSTRVARNAGIVGLGWHQAVEGIKPWVIARLGSAALTRMAQRDGYRQNDHLLGSYDFRGGESRYRERLASWLHLASDGDLLMCHAGVRVDVDDSILDARIHEFTVLSGEAFPEMLRREGIVLAPLSRVFAERGDTRQIE